MKAPCIWLLILAVWPLQSVAQGNQETLARANTDFAFDLFKQIARGPSGRNIFISPYSVSSVLQMVGNGAADKTKEEMDRVLHLNGLTSPNPACKGLGQAITNGQKDVILNLANSFWYRKGVELKPEFAAACSNYFQAESGALDFSNPQSARTINDWAEQNTHGRIKDLVSWPIDPMTRVILASAIYFKGHWAREFDKRATKEHAFTLSDGKQEQAPMMEQRGHFFYFEGTGFQAVRLPYAGARLQMYLFLPVTNSSVKQMLADFDGGSWQNKILPRFRDCEGLVMLPRFKLNYSVRLNNSLEALGMRQAFSSAADFSAMSNEKLYLSEVKQKSFVEVNEEGTEAAAATTAYVRAMALMRPQAPFEMVLDRPFFFVIGDQTTHSIMFMGIVSDPGAVVPEQ